MDFLNEANLYLVSTVVFYIFMLMAGWSDLRSGKISNRLTVGFAVCACIITVTRAVSGIEYTSDVFGCGVTFFVLLLLYLSGGMGGGDVKLGIGVGLCLGYPRVILCLFYGSLIALTMILFRLAWRGELLGGLKTAFRIKNKKSDDSQGAEDITPKVGASYATALLIASIWIDVAAQF